MFGFVLTDEDLAAEEESMEPTMHHRSQADELSQWVEDDLCNNASQCHFTAVETPQIVNFELPSSAQVRPPKGIRVKAAVGMRRTMSKEKRLNVLHEVPAPLPVQVAAPETVSETAAAGVGSNSVPATVPEQHSRTRMPAVKRLKALRCSQRKRNGPGGSGRCGTDVTIEVTTTEVAPEPVPWPADFLPVKEIPRGLAGLGYITEKKSLHRVYLNVCCTRENKPVEPARNSAAVA